MVDVPNATARIDFDPKTGEVTKITHYHKVNFSPEMMMALAKMALDALNARNKEEKSKELYDMCERNPSYLPLVEVAKLLGGDAAELQEILKNGRGPFDTLLQKDNNGNRILMIHTASFITWYTSRPEYK